MIIVVGLKFSEWLSHFKLIREKIFSCRAALFTILKNVFVKQNDPFWNKISAHKCVIVLKFNYSQKSMC